MEKLKPLNFARHLRKNQTSAEAKLWGCLRKRSLNGYRFIRQVSIGPYTVDFLCREKALVVEVDGATHGEVSEVTYDVQRTAFLAMQGLVVVRVNNEDIYRNMVGVLEGLHMQLAARSSKFKSSFPLRPSGTSPSEAEGG